MKSKILRYLPFVCLLIAAFWIRHHQLVDRSPFDWDQNRDYGQLLEIAKGNFVVLGPIAKGIGGVYLGSLYYYLLYPAFYLMKGDLVALPLTSIILDSLAAGAIYLLLSSKLGKLKSLIVALIWTFSWFTISASHVSWNVALLPLWSLAAVSAFSAFLDRPQAKLLYLLALLTGLSFHVHITAIPVIPFLMLVNYRKFKFPLITWALAIGVGLLPILPLIIYDLTHSLSNIRQARALLWWQVKTGKAPMLAVVSNAFTKLGKSVAGLLVANFANNLYLGILTILLAIFSLRSRQNLLKVAGSITLISFLFVIALRELGFPEYYFATAYLPILILIINLAFTLTKRLGIFGYLVLILGLALCLRVNLQAYFKPSEPSYELGVKQRMVESLVKIGQPLEIRYNLVPGREGGFGYLIERSGIVIDPTSKYKAIITDNRDHGAYYEGELAKDLIIEGHLKTAVYYDVR